MVGIPSAPIAPIEARKVKSFYLPELDAIRFVAFFAVFLYHGSFLAADSGNVWAAIAYSGAFGMCLFFVLSSYLITKLLMKEMSAASGINVRKFYVRRSLRIMPLYFSFIAAIAVAGIFHRSWHVPASGVLSFGLMFFGNWYLIFHPITGPIMPLWSISLEEQFYLVWPHLFARTSKKVFGGICVALIPISCISIWLLRSSGRWGYADIWWNTLSHLQFFGIGALLALDDTKIDAGITGNKRMCYGLLSICFWVLGGLANSKSVGGGELWLRRGIGH